MQRTQPEYVLQGRSIVALSRTNPYAPRRKVRASGATIHILYQEGLRPSISPPCKYHCKIFKLSIIFTR